MGTPMMMGYYGGFGGSIGAWFLGILALALFFSGAALLTIAARRAALAAQRKRTTISDDQLAAEVLKERYATGKISFEEYEQALDALGDRALLPEAAPTNSSSRRAPNMLV